MITIHDELMGYKGNFKSNHKIRKRLDDITKTGKKKETDNKLILCNPEIGSSTEIITGTVGCGVGVKALRYCFKNLLDDHTDAHFTGRLMKIVTEIYHRDTECSHSDTRFQATLTMSELSIKPVYIPRSATHYRFLNHLSIISDYTYSEINQRFEPLSLLNTLNAVAYSKYIPVGVPLTDEIVVSLPVNDDLPVYVSVIQCVGIIYYTKSGLENLIIMRGSGVMVYEVF
jgi:hypothetical protein